MTLLEDFPRAVKGAWRLFVWDAEGVNYFDQTIEGFWRSFLAPLLLLPVYYLTVVENHRILSEALEANPEFASRPMAPLSAFVWTNLSAYAIGIAAFPIAMVFISRLLQLTSSYVPMIIAYNWAHVIIIGLIATPMALHGIGVIGTMPASALAFLAMLVQPFYLFSIFRATTHAPGMTVFGLVLFEIILTFAIALGTETVFLG